MNRGRSPYTPSPLNCPRGIRTAPTDLYVSKHYLVQISTNALSHIDIKRRRWKYGEADWEVYECTMSIACADQPPSFFTDTILTTAQRAI